MIPTSMVQTSELTVLWVVLHDVHQTGTEENPIMIATDSDYIFKEATKLLG